MPANSWTEATLWAAKAVNAPSTKQPSPAGGRIFFSENSFEFPPYRMRQVIVTKCQCPCLTCKESRLAGTGPRISSGDQHATGDGIFLRGRWNKAQCMRVHPSADFLRIADQEHHEETWHTRPDGRPQARRQIRPGMAHRSMKVRRILGQIRSTRFNPRLPLHRGGRAGVG